MSRYPVFYCSPEGVGAGFRPVEAADAYEAEQIVQREHPGAVTASERARDQRSGDPAVVRGLAQQRLSR